MKPFSILVENRGIQLVVVDGIEGEKYDIIMEGSLVFSPDSKRVAYVATEYLGHDYLVRSKQQFAVVDGIEGEHHDGVVKGSLTFSPDSKRVAYTAKRGRLQFVVVDGEEGQYYDEVVKGSLTFSPDSSRVAFLAKGRQGRWFAVVDGVEG